MILPYKYKLVEHYQKNICQYAQGTFCFNSYSASHDNWCTETLWNRVMAAQCEGMGEVGSARYEPEHKGFMLQ